MKTLKSIISVISIYISISFIVIGSAFYFDIDEIVFRYLGFLFLCVVSDKVSKWIYKTKKKDNI